MKLVRSVFTLMMCCSALWVVVSSDDEAPPPACDSMLAFSSQPPSSSQGNIHSRSLAPWKWRASTVKNRIPSTLWEAECVSSFCTSRGHTNKHNLNSVPIYQNFLVLIRQEEGHCYTASYQAVAVGCTCTWAKTNQN